MKKITLLLVDDHPFVLDGIRHFLGKTPEMEVIGAVHSGQAALDVLKERQADVVVLDVSMPGELDGIETAVEIRRLYPNTKIILLTMFDDSRRILKALQIGIHGYVLKDKTRDTLMAAIHAVCSGPAGRYYSPDVLAKAGAVNPVRADKEPSESLTRRQKEIICLLARNPSLTAKQIGEQLHIAPFTVQTHIRNVKAVLGVSKSAEVVKYAVETKLCEG
ncbi:MAG: response regulator transcription factor [Saprospiraceae bacterium]|nr:response regulator transcription factor [Saprospiraceae bacterium]